MFAYQHKQQERKSTSGSGHTVPELILLLVSVVSSLFHIICWSSFYQKLHTWVLFSIAYYPRKVTYVQSNNNLTFAIRSDSGLFLFLWQQKRYQRHNLLYTGPFRLAL